MTFDDVLTSLFGAPDKAPKMTPPVAAPRNPQRVLVGRIRTTTPVADSAAPQPFGAFGGDRVSAYKNDQINGLTQPLNTSPTARFDAMPGYMGGLPNVNSGARMRVITPDQIQDPLLSNSRVWT